MESDPNTSDADDPEGEFGGSTKRQRMKATRMVERAVAEFWPIGDERRGPLIERLFKIAMNPKANSRAVTAAARAIFVASKINLESVDATLGAREHEELEGRLTELEQRVLKKGGPKG
jgi:hypothetical protein